MPKIPSIVYVVGLVQAVIAVAAPLLAHFNGGLVAVITIIAAILSAVATYVSTHGVKTALKSAGRPVAGK